MHARAKEGINAVRKIGTEREREGQTDRNRDTDRHRERQTDRDRERRRETEFRIIHTRERRGGGRPLQTGGSVLFVWSVD